MPSSPVRPLLVSLFINFLVASTVGGEIDRNIRDIITQLWRLIWYGCIVRDFLRVVPISTGNVVTLEEADGGESLCLGEFAVGNDTSEDHLIRISGEVITGQERTLLLHPQLRRV